MNIVIIGLTLTSSWGNGHATTFRSLIKGLHKRGHHVTFLERDMPWYASNRDMPDPPFCKVHLYESVAQLKFSHRDDVANADVVIVGSYVPDGIEVGEWVLNEATGITAFYDIDTPVTLSKLWNGTCSYLNMSLIPRYDMYLSFSAGRCLDIFKHELGSPDAKALYCSVDPDLYYPLHTELQWDLGYLGTYSDDRQPTLNKLLIEPARQWADGRFIVAGSQYPDNIHWPANVERIEHLPPTLHVNFYNSQRYTLNVTRDDMIKMGYSPSVRLFEAAACGVPIISDYWEGIESIFQPGREILISSSPEHTLEYVTKIPENQRRKIGENARIMVLEKHTGEHRAMELENYLLAPRDIRLSSSNKWVLNS